MAREYARVRVDIWVNDDVRELSPPAQHLYFVLLTSPQLSYCGVTDWRPGRIAAAAKSWTADDIRRAAAELTARLYIVPDEDTEEVLIRSFIRHDGLMKESRVAVSMVKAFGAVASNKIRGVIVHELRRLHDEDETLNGWRTTKGEPGQALALLKLNALDPAGLAQGLADRLGVGLGQTSTNVWGSVWGSVSGSTSPAPTPTPAPSSSNEEEKNTGPRKRGTRIPEDFTPSEDLYQFAAEQGFTRPQAEAVTAEFCDYWRGVAGAKGVKLDWDATWKNWVRRQDPARVRPNNVRAITGDSTYTAAELDQILGPPRPLPQPPRGLDENAMWEWEQQTRREQRAERVRQANAKLGRSA